MSTPTITPSSAAETYARCDSCDAPLDQQQRYCVNCGTRRKDVDDPAMSYFAKMAARGRGTSDLARAPQRSGPPIAAAILICLIPVAVAIGVLVGQSGGSDEDKVLSALRNQKPQVVNLGGAGAAGAANAATTSGRGLKSTWTLDKGFTVKVGTLPVAGTDQAAATKAEQDATAKGATQVGLINLKQFTTTPSQPATSYVIYSGQFKARAQAEAALKKLKKSFPDAVVLQVAAAAGASQSKSGDGKVVARTKYGTAHQVTGFKASKQKVEQDRQLVQKINKEQGKNYIDGQKNLPDQIVVTGGDPNAGPTSGDGQP